MRLGIHHPDFTLPGGPAAIAKHVGETAIAADEGGCAQFTVMDHWFQMESRGDPDQPMLEGYTTLGYLAGLTSRIRLGLLVTGVTYRYPGLLAKTVATLDVLSGGRAILGLGAAWYEREHLALGVPYPPIAQRFEMLDETLAICRQMFSDDTGPFHGEHYSLESTLCNPAPLGHVPVLIGGGGEKKTLKLVARYADACNFFGLTPDGVTAKLDVLRRHCDDEGTDFDAIEKTLLVQYDAVGDPDGFLALAEEYRAVGVDMLVMTPADQDDPAGYVRALTGAVVERLAAI